MSISGLRPMDRRMAIGGALAGAAGLALPNRQRVVFQRGVVGGGLVQWEEGKADVSLFASELTFDPENILVLGSVLWFDEVAGLMLTSTRVTGYFETPSRLAQKESRQFVGDMRVNDERELPFDLVVVDLSKPGEKTRDRVSLIVGDGARDVESATPVAGLGFTYRAEGELVSGDIQRVPFTINPDSGVIEVGVPPE
jgi:hypothetical protein